MYSCHMFSIVDLGPVDAISLLTHFPCPSASIKSMCRDFRQSLPHSIVGVHIRKTDNIRSRESCPDWLFEKEIESIITAGSNVYLATDCGRTRNRLVSRYGHAIRYLPYRTRLLDRWPRQNVGGVEIEDDYLDLITLAECQYVLGSTFSTYSETAIAMNGSPLSRLLSVNTYQPGDNSI